MSDGIFDGKLEGVYLGRIEGVRDGFLHRTGRILCTITSKAVTPDVDGDFTLLDTTKSNIFVLVEDIYDVILK